MAKLLHLLFVEVMGIEFLYDNSTISPFTLHEAQTRLIKNSPKLCNLLVVVKQNTLYTTPKWPRPICVSICSSLGSMYHPCLLAAVVYKQQGFNT